MYEAAVNVGTSTGLGGTCCRLCGGLTGHRPVTILIDYSPPSFPQYLQYKNVRPDYLREIWKVINWKEAAARFEAAAKGA